MKNENWENIAPNSYTSRGKKIRRSGQHKDMWLIGDNMNINADDKTILKLHPPDESK
jgi:hypothetical protein